MPGNTKGIYYRYVYCHRLIAVNPIFVQPFPTTSLILCCLLFTGVLRLKQQEYTISTGYFILSMATNDEFFVIEIISLFCWSLRLKEVSFLCSAQYLAGVLSTCSLFAPVLTLRTPLKRSLEPSRMGFLFIVYHNSFTNVFAAGTSDPCIS